MVVLRESAAAITEVPSIPDSIHRRRENLATEGILVRRDDAFIFMQDTLFSSPSTAAGVVMGRSANGWVEWKDHNGNTLDKNEAGGDHKSEASIVNEYVGDGVPDIALN
jgi:hypothetical protein